MPIESPTTRPTRAPFTDGPTGRPFNAANTNEADDAATDSAVIPLAPKEPYHDLPPNPATRAVPERRFVEWAKLDDAEKAYAKKQLSYVKTVSF